MAVIVIPLHIKQLFTSLSAEELNDGSVKTTCQLQVFFHLLVICGRSWSLAGFMMLHHVYEGIIPTVQSLIVLTIIWITSSLLVLPTILVKDSFVDFQICALIPHNYGEC